jgi:hypothetical protein
MKSHGQLYPNYFDSKDFNQMDYFFFYSDWLKMDMRPTWYKDVTGIRKYFRKE